MDRYYVRNGQERQGPYSLAQMEDVPFFADTQVWRDDMPQKWMPAAQYPELLPYTNRQPPPVDEVEQKPSFVDRFYGWVSRQLDVFLAHNKDKVGVSAPYTYLAKARAFYKSLSTANQRAFSFFVSTALVFIATLLFTFSLFKAYTFTVFCVAFVAIQQFKYIARAVQWVTEIAVAIGFFFVPEVVRASLGRLAAAGVAFFLAIFFGWLVGPAYFLYRLVTFVLQVQEDPYVSTEQRKEFL